MKHATKIKETGIKVKIEETGGTKRKRGNVFYGPNAALDPLDGAW